MKQKDLVRRLACKEDEHVGVFGIRFLILRSYDTTPLVLNLFYSNFYMKWKYCLVRDFKEHHWVGHYSSRDFERLFLNPRRSRLHWKASLLRTPFDRQPPSAEPFIQLTTSINSLKFRFNLIGSDDETVQDGPSARHRPDLSETHGHQREGIRLLHLLVLKGFPTRRLSIA